MKTEKYGHDEAASLVLDPPRIPSLADLQVRLFPREDLAVLRDKWLGMEAVSEHTFFTSWHWISCWLGLVETEVLQCEAWAGEDLVGLGLFVENREMRGLVPMRRLFLHRTGRQDLDRISIHWNDLLLRRGMEARVRNSVIEHLARRPGVDEVVFGLSREGQGAEVTGPRIVNRIGWSAPAPWIDLRHITDGEGYDKALPIKLRKNVKRSLRKAETLGKVEVRSAATVEEALRFFRESGPYHVERFKDGKTGRQSGYLIPSYVAFHERLIRSTFDCGCVDLIKMTAGDALLAYIYYFVYRKTVYVYQAAVNYAPLVDASQGNMSPGVLAHYLGVTKFAAQGMEKIDFLAGDHFYKRALATESNSMMFYNYRKPSLKMAAVEKLQSVKRMLKRGKT